MELFVLVHLFVGVALALGLMLGDVVLFAISATALAF